MYIQNTVIELQWVLSKTASVFDQSYFDLRISDPDGVVTHYEGSGLWAKSFLAPVELTDGLITRDITPTKTGVYSIVLSTGDSNDYTILANMLMNVVSQDSTRTDVLILD